MSERCKVRRQPPYVSSAREKEVQDLDLVIIFAEILSKNLMVIINNTFVC